MRDATSPHTHSAPAADHADLRSGDAAASALRDFEQAASGEDVAYCMSGAFDAVLRHSAVSSIGQNDRIVLQNALRCATDAATCLLPSSFPLAALQAGASALHDIIAAWCEPPGRDDASRRGHPADLRAVARMLQNEFHNASLREEIEARGRQIESRHRPSSSREWLH